MRYVLQLQDTDVRTKQKPNVHFPKAVEVAFSGTEAIAEPCTAFVTEVCILKFLDDG